MRRRGDVETSVRSLIVCEASADTPEWKLGSKVKMMQVRRASFLRRLPVVAGSVVIAILWTSNVVHGEWYVAGQVGPTFADKLANIELTDFSNRPPDLDLKNSIAYGAKLGYFGGHGWFGLEGEIFNTTPHIKQDIDPGIHLRVTTLALNFIARYPGATFQPYAGIGFGLMFAHLSESPTTRSDSDTGTGLNLLAGLRMFVTPYISMFTEYKYVQSSLLFSDALGPNGGFVGDYRAQHLMLGLAYHF